MRAACNVGYWIHISWYQTSKIAIDVTLATRNRVSLTPTVHCERVLLIAISEAALREVVVTGGEHVFYTSPNGDVWSLIRVEGTDTINVQHQPNAPSGGNLSLTTLQNFLSGHHGPQHDALIQLIRIMIGEALDRKVRSEDV